MEYAEISTMFDMIEDIIDNSSGEDIFYKILLEFSHRIMDSDSEDSPKSTKASRRFAVGMYQSLISRIQRQIGIMTDFAHGSMEDFIVKHFGRADSEVLFKTIDQWMLFSKYC